MKKIHSTLIASLLVIAFSITIHGDTECSSYTFLNESNRAKTYYDSNTRLCDDELSGWYRFGGEAGNQMADSCVSMRHCGAGLPGWLQGSHPSVADGVVSRRVCFRWYNYCCSRSIVILVRNCGSFYVYKLKPPPVCNSRYCGNGLPSVSECSNYKFLGGANRARTYQTTGSLQSDTTLSGWYRFGGQAGNKIAASCVNPQHCGTNEPGWLSGTHPSVADGIVKRKVCFHWRENCCGRSTYIDVRNCGEFYVYKLKPPPARNLRYCGNGLPTTSECSKYRFLNESNRAKTYHKLNQIKCDKTLSSWYRFGGEAGIQMAETCVSMLRCNTYEPGWLNGSHPSVADGAVERKVCFHVHQCCAWSTFITVRNCGEFYVYKLKPLKRCGRFCGNGLVHVSAPTAKPVTLQTKDVNKVSSRKVPTTKQTLTVTTIMNSSLATVLRTEVYSTECSSYTFLNESNRANTYYDSNTLLCDRELSGWYRFGGEAGNQMADSCVKRRHCGAGLPGWLQGGHPSVADGVVRRRVCFQWSDYCCRLSTVIDVRNCGRFYAYKLKPPPVCNSRYCGNGLPSVSECSNYRFLNASNRAKTYGKFNLIRCDRTLSGWYRFGGEAGNQMADSCVSMRRCSTYETGWLNGPHPSVADGAVERKNVPPIHSLMSQIEQKPTKIVIPSCAIKNCRAGIGSEAELEIKWRILVSAGDIVERECQAGYKEVILQWLMGRSTQIDVRNCGKFYVYKLKKPPVCNARYCGNGVPSVSDSTTTASVPGAIGQKCDCHNYTSFTIVIIVVSLAAVLFVVSLFLSVVVVLLLKKRRGHGKDARNPADKWSQFKDQHSSALSPANVARELRPVLSEAEAENIEHGNQRQEIELVESAGQECAYTMLSVPGDSSYASLVKFKQKAQESVSESSVDALYVLQPKEEPTDELPIYVNQMTSDYMNI
ncbi:hypothetical protein ACROYT_G020134 [Oculina patagonica]